MLTYTPPESGRPAGSREYPWMLLLLVFAWLWPGVFSHDLWRPYEPETFAAVEHFLRHGSVAGTSTLPPPYVWLAALFVRLLSPWALDAYSAARVASVVFTALGLAGCGMACARMLDRHAARSMLLVLIASAGLTAAGHFLGPVPVLFAGAGLYWWGMAAAQRQVVFSGVLSALALLLLFQAGGALVAAAALLAGVLPHVFAGWRRRHLLWLLCTLAVALPLLASHFLLLAKNHPAAFDVYLRRQLFGVFGGLDGFQAAFSLPYYLMHLAWFALPAWPLALWTAVKTPAAQRAVFLPALCWLAVFGLLLALMPQHNRDYLVLLLPPLALAASAQLDSLKRGVAAFFNWFGMMTFGLAAVFLWLGFMAMNYGYPARLAARAAYFSPYYTPHIRPLPILFALLFGLMWLVAVRRRRIRGRQAVTNWAAGITLVWALLFTLFLPWLDAAKSYRPVVLQMEQSLDAAARADFAAGACLLIRRPNSDGYLAWQQYGSLKIGGENDNCRYELLETDPRTEAVPENALWQGRRPRSKNQLFVLVRHDGF